MRRTALAAVAAGTMLVAVPPSAFASSWEPTSGTATLDAVNPCTGQSTDFTFAWSQVKVKSTGSGTVRIGLTGTYTAADGSSGTVRTSSSTSQTKDGYTDSYRRLLVGTYDGRAQRLTFVFRIVVGAEGDDVKVMQTGASCGG